MLRKEQPKLGIFTMAVGVLALTDWLELAFRLEVLAVFEVLQLFSAYIWLIWLGIVIWRRDEQQQQVMEVAMAD